MYKKVSQIAQDLALCKQEVRRKIKLMQASNLYPASVFLVRPLRVDEDAFIHFNVFQSLIDQGTIVPEWSESWQRRSGTN